MLCMRWLLKWTQMIKALIKTTALRQQFDTLGSLTAFEQITRPRIVFVLDSTQALRLFLRAELPSSSVRHTWNVIDEMVRNVDCFLLKTNTATTTNHCGWEPPALINTICIPCPVFLIPMSYHCEPCVRAFGSFRPPPWWPLFSYAIMLPPTVTFPHSVYGHFYLAN